MSRIVVDESLRRWEAFTTIGLAGKPERPHLAFQCLSDPVLRPRYAAVAGTLADAARLLVSASDAELLEMLERSGRDAERPAAPF